MHISFFFFLAKLKKVKKKKKRGEGELLDEERTYVNKIFAKFSHDAPLSVVKKKHLTIEQLNVRRRKVWLTIAKKEIPKVGVLKKRDKNSFLCIYYTTIVCFVLFFGILFYFFAVMV